MYIQLFFKIILDYIHKLYLNLINTNIVYENNQKKSFYIIILVLQNTMNNLNVSYIISYRKHITLTICVKYIEKVELLHTLYQDKTIIP